MADRKSPRRGDDDKTRPRRDDDKTRPRRDDDDALKALRSKLAGVLKRLPDIERQVVELRMGLVDGTPAKPGETAERLGLTIHEVRTIEQRAFNRIREVVPMKSLERFLNR